MTSFAPTESKRIFAVDFLKAVAILAVVWGHIASPLTSFIFAWHMPAFFLASGLLLREKQKEGERFTAFSQKDFFYLGKFYLIFGVFGIFMEYLKIRMMGREPLDLWDTAVGFVYYMDMPHLHHYGFILWFLPALFWGKFFSRCLLRYMRKEICVCLAVVLFAVGLFLPADVQLPFGMREGFLAVLWCMTGVLIFPILRTEMDRWHRAFILVGGILLFFLPVPALNLGDYVISSPVFTFLYSVFVAILLLSVGHWVSLHHTHLNTICTYLSRRSIYIMGLHVYTNNFSTVFLAHFHIKVWWMRFFLSCAMLAVVLGTLEVLWLARKRKRERIA